MLIDPGQYRVNNELLQKECKGRGRIETMMFAATAATDNTQATATAATTATPTATTPAATATTATTTQ